MEIQKFISELGFPIFCAVLLLIQYISFTRFFFSSLISHFKEISTGYKESINHLSESFEKVSNSLNGLIKNCPVSENKIKEAIREELKRKDNH